MNKKTYKMKVILVKNEEFKTIGVDVRTENETMFRWGISPSPMYWTKEVPFEQNAITIAELIKLQATQRAKESYYLEWFETAEINNIKEAMKKAKRDFSINFSNTDKEIKQLIATIERKVNTLK